MTRRNLPGQLRYYPVAQDGHGWPGLGVDRIDQIVAQAVERRSEGPDESARGELCRYQRLAQQRYSLTGDCGLDGAAFIVDGDAALCVEPAKTRFSRPCAPGRHGHFLRGRPPFEMDKRGVKKIFGRTKVP